MYVLTEQNARRVQRVCAGGGGGVPWRWVTGHMCQPPGMDDAYVRTFMPFPTPCATYLDPMLLPPEKFW